MMFFLVLCMLLADTILATTDAGIRTVVTSKGLDYFNTVGIPLLQQDLLNTEIPDISGSSDVAIIGEVDYTISNIKLTYLNIGSSDISSSSEGLNLEVSDVSISGTTDWSYSNNGWIKISDSGSADLSVSGVSFSVSVLVGKDSNGHVTLSSSDCSLSVDSVSVDFHGGASWLYNLFDSTIEGFIKSAMQDNLCDTATNAINDKGSAIVESLPDTIQLDEVSEISYALISDPVFTDDYVQTDFKGEFMSIANPVDVPLTPTSLPNPSSFDKMMYVWLTDYVANSAGMVYHNAGILQYTITPDIVPKGVPFKLNTASFESLIPSLYKRFRDLDMEVTIKSTKPPTMKVVPQSANFIFTGSINVKVMYANKTKVDAFSLGITLHSDVRVWIDTKNATKQILAANFTMLKFDMDLLSTNIGNFSVKTLEKSVNVLVNAIGMPLLNRKVNSGLILPVMDGLSFVDSKITLGNGYIMIGSDIQYQTSFMLRRRKHQAQ